MHELRCPLTRHANDHEHAELFFLRRVLVALSTDRGNRRSLPVAGLPADVDLRSRDARAALLDPWSDENRVAIRRNVDTSPLGNNPLNLWLKRRRVDVEQQRQVAKAVRESGAEAPIPRNSLKPGDTRQLRGIPVVGLGVSGAPPEWRPGFKLERESAE